MRVSTILAMALGWHLITAGADAALIVNAPRPIVERVNVNLIAVADDDGTDSTAGMLGSGAVQAEIFSLVDTIYAQAGVDVAFAYRSGTYNSSFARTGDPGENSPRPQSDLSAIRGDAAAVGGVLSSNTNTINVFLVTIVPGFSQLSANSSAGLATINGNGIGYYGGANLLGYTGGREVLASVLAHEIGHNLGLSHVSTSQNLMRSGGGIDDGERLTDSQIQTILASRFTVAAPQGQTGDFDGNGSVNGSDFLRWQRGQSPAPLSTADLTAWKQNAATAAAVTPVGFSSAAGHAVEIASPVPEPAAGTLLALALLSGVAIRRARRDR